MTNIYKKLKYVLAAVLMAAVILNAEAGQALAASASVILTTDAPEARVGDVIALSIDLAADSVPGSFDGFLKYDSAKVEYVTGPDCVAGGEGLLKISDSGVGSDHTSRKYILYFKAAAIGEAVFNMRGTPEVCDSDDGYLMSVSTIGCSVEIGAATKASNDAFLSVLKISPGALSPAFDGGIYEYTASVGAEADSIFVSAIAHDANASVAIEGDKGLQPGENTVTVTVSAEDGSRLEYRIKVNKAAAEAAAPDEEPEVDSTPNTGSEVVSSDVSGWAFYAEEKDGGLMLVADTRYKIVEDSKLVSIPKDYKEMSLLISGHKVTAYALSTETDPEFVLLVLEKEGGAPGLYIYDRTEKTIQRYRQSADKGSLSREQELALVDSYEKSISNLTLIMTLMGVACAALLLISIVMTIKAHTGKRRKSSGRSTSSGYSSSKPKSTKTGTTKRKSSSGQHFDARG